MARHRSRERRTVGAACALLLLLALGALVASDTALAHKKGKAEPRIAAGLAGSGLSRTLTVRLTDIDSKKPVKGATVVATPRMGEPHGMAVGDVRLDEVSPARYRGVVRFPMEGRWTIAITVTGKKVITAKARLPARIAAGPGTGEGMPMEEGHVMPLGTTLEDESLTRSDVTNMVSLWIHGIAALAWIVGVLVMVLALSTRPGVLAESIRDPVANAYRRWGAWLHWALVPVIVLTGVYQMLNVTPFELAYTPSDFERLADIPYGLLYEAILIAKLTLFGVLLVTGTITLVRTLRAPLPALAYGNPHPAGAARTLLRALGASGVVYVLSVPLILAAAMALRYVHVLNHVAVTLQHG